MKEMCFGHLFRRADGTWSLDWLKWLNPTQQTGKHDNSLEQEEGSSLNTPGDN